MKMKHHFINSVRSRHKIGVRLPKRERLYEYTGLKPVEFSNLKNCRRKVWLSAYFAEQFQEMDYWNLGLRRQESAKEQVSYILNFYAEGAHRLDDTFHYRALKGFDYPVYELKTQDIRIFGFLLRPGEFCAVLAKPKGDLLRYKLYEKPIKEVISFIEELLLPSPKFSKDRFDAIFK